MNTKLFVLLRLLFYFFPKLTWNETESLAVKATISAHETTPGHAFSTAFLISAIMLNPPRGLDLEVRPFQLYYLL